MTIRGLLSSFPPHCMLPPWPGIRGDSLNLQNCILWSVAAAGHRVSATYKRTIGILLLLILSSYYYYHFSVFSAHHQVEELTVGHEVDFRSLLSFISRITFGTIYFFSLATSPEKWAPVLTQFLHLKLAKFH